MTVQIGGRGTGKKGMIVRIAGGMATEIVMVKCATIKRKKNWAENSPSPPFLFLPPQEMTSSRLPTFRNASNARSISDGSCAALNWTRIRAFPLGTTG